MALCRYFIEFMLFSLIGWVYECIYCTLHDHKWQNRGFLFGPVCPIYGVGAVSTLVIFGEQPYTRLRCLLAGIPYTRELADSVRAPLWQVFLVCAVGSFFLEYGTSYLLEKRFHAVWWDYNDMPLNINGRVCLPATLGFGAAGVLIVRFVLPWSMRFHALPVPESITALTALLLMAFFAADLALTVESLKQLSGRLELFEKSFNEQMENAYRTMEGAPAAIRARVAEQIPERMKEYAAQLTRVQSRAIRGVKHFSRRFGSVTRAQIGEQLLAAARALRRGGRMVVERIRPGEEKAAENLMKETEGADTYRDAKASAEGKAEEALRKKEE